jgi:hypothetical protein
VPDAQTLQAPTTLNLYPVNYAVNPRLFVFVQAGTEHLALPLAFDTGSSGMTLNALRVFPPSIVDANGFKFPPGEDSITYSGIMVTKVHAQRMYGGAGGRTEIGNIGFAQISFGDAGGMLTTRMMPVLFFYSMTEAGTVLSGGSQPQEGWFGVNSALDELVVDGVTESQSGFPECALGVTGTCVVASVLDYLSYAPGTSAGLLLSQAQLEQCDVTVPLNCTPQPILTVGLTDSMKEGFSRWNLSCGTRLVAGYHPCAATVPNTVFTVTGSASGMLIAPSLFDSGTPEILIRVPMSTVFPPAIYGGEAATVNTPSGFDYNYQSASEGIYSTAVAYTTTPEIVVGLPFFTQNLFYIDLANGDEGWKSP